MVSLWKLITMEDISLFCQDMPIPQLHHVRYSTGKGLSLLLTARIKKDKEIMILLETITMAYISTGEETRTQKSTIDMEEENLLCIKYKWYWGI